MAIKRIALKKYTGIYYSESSVKIWRDRPDRTYWVRFKEEETGRYQWVKCGSLSTGWTPEMANLKRHNVVSRYLKEKYKSKKQRQREALTFGDLMERHYLPWADQEKKRARDDRSLYSNWLARRFEKKPLNDISPLDLERLKQAMRMAGKAEATVKHALCLVRQAYNKAVAWGLWKGENPCKAVKFPAPNNARQRFLTREEADRLLIAVREKSPQVARVAALSLFGGLRLSEVLGLAWGHVDRVHGIIHVMDAKNNENRPVFITKPIEDVLDELAAGDPDEPLFQTKKGRPVVWLSKTFKAVVDELGLNAGVTDPRQKVTFHTLRHTYASWAVMAGVPLYVVGRAVGHKTTVMTQRYLTLRLRARDRHLRP